jgi:ABC-2 type transport system ATP-binding protein
VSALEAAGLTKRYGRREALRDVSLRVEAGERVAVIGPNGAGKTTLLALLGGLVPATAGEVSRAPRDVGWVPQRAAVYGKLTVRENLELFARLERVPDVGAAVGRALALTGLEDRAGDELGTLSGGNRQRVNIAVGLLGDPPVLLLDEPSAALDPRQREVLWTFVDGLARDGTAIIFTTHDIGEAERHGDRVLVLAEGDVLFDGAPAALRDGAADLQAAFVALLERAGR